MSNKQPRWYEFWKWIKIFKVQKERLLELEAHNRKLGQRVSDLEATIRNTDIGKLQKENRKFRDALQEIAKHNTSAEDGSRPKVWMQLGHLAAQALKD